MLLPALIPGEFVTAAAVLFLLFGVPAILFGLLMLYTGYVRYDAEQYLEELEAEAAADASGDEIEAESGDTHQTGRNIEDEPQTGSESGTEPRIGDDDHTENES